MNYDEIISKRTAGIKPSGIRKFFDILESMPEAISLGVGEPDFITPWHIRDAGIYSLEQGRTKYTSNSGLTVLREEISRYLDRRFGLKYDGPSQILITVGGSEAIDLAVRCIVNPGEEVIVPQPSFVCYGPITSLASGVPVIVELKADNGFKLTPEILKAAITEKTKAVVLPFPSNPTGGIMTREDLEAIAPIIKEHNLIVISDEIYAELSYNDHHVSIASIEGMYERTIVINGMSKAYSMTGWRLGYACGPKELIQQMTKIHQFAIMSAPTTSQYAAIEAVRNGDKDIEDMKAEYDGRRKFVLKGLAEAGLPCFEPQGAFYIFPSIAASGMSSEEFAETLLKEEQVAVIAGNAFGDCGEGFVRICYCASMANLEEAIVRIKRFMTRHHI